MKPTLFLALLLACGGAPAQTITPLSSFRLEADAARFAGGDSLSYVEIYYGISEGALTYAPTPGGYHGAVLMGINVSDTVKTVASKEWTLPRTLEDTTRLRSPRNILSFESLALSAGDYRVTVHARDSIDPGRFDSAVIILRVSPIARRTTLSDIELSSSILPAPDRTSPFYKNTLEVLPNPSRLYGEGLPVVHFYVEIYNLDRDPGPPATLRASIRDQRGEVVVSQSKPKPRTTGSSVEFGSMNVSSLPGGSYVLRIALEDSAVAPPGTLAATEKRFFVYNPSVTAATPAAGGSASDRLLSVLGEPEADEEVRKIRYISTDAERQLAERLPDLEAKRNFLKAFWGTRGGGGDVPGTDPREAYLARVREADERFAGRGQAGWLTDRGRVWILYGPPDNVERNPSTAGTRPYEQWEYNAIQGGVVFVFVDRSGFGSYRLVHSTHLNELRNEDWYRQEAEIR